MSEVFTPVLALLRGGSESWWSWRDIIGIGTSSSLVKHEISPPSLLDQQNSGTWQNFMFTNTDLVFVRDTVSSTLVQLYHCITISRIRLHRNFPRCFLKLFGLAVIRYNVSCSLATSSHKQLPQEHSQELRPNSPSPHPCQWALLWPAHTWLV